MKEFVETRLAGNALAGQVISATVDISKQASAGPESSGSGNTAMRYKRPNPVACPPLSPPLLPPALDTIHRHSVMPARTDRAGLWSSSWVTARRKRIHATFAGKCREDLRNGLVITHSMHVSPRAMCAVSNRPTRTHGTVGHQCKRVDARRGQGNYGESGGQYDLLKVVRVRRSPDADCAGDGVVRTHAT